MHPALSAPSDTRPRCIKREKLRFFSYALDCSFYVNLQLPTSNRSFFSLRFRLPTNNRAKLTIVNKKTAFSLNFGMIFSTHVKDWAVISFLVFQPPEVMSNEFTVL